ncbi:MAG: YabP/YqfC family sporulation protein [Lachnospiraceae bacterium]|nr:YabP/YqfC family sporulation protein [Lachnospiraceae bacterium]
MTKSGDGFRAVFELLKLPTDVACGDTRIYMIGKSKLKIENYRSVLVYSETMIKIQLIHKKIVIEGEQLQIRYYDKEEMEIIGCIEVLRFE